MAIPVKIQRRLNRLCRRLVVELRDRNTCQRCGATAERSQIQWAHVHNRQAKSIQWTPWNSLALCAGCHFWFDGNHRESARSQWWAGKWPERALAYGVWRSDRRQREPDAGLLEQWLKQEIERYERIG